MCIAIYKPKDSKISQATLQECFRSNPDGAGFMYAHNKELVMEKGFFTFNDFWEAYKKHEKKQAVLHFRIKTHGAIDEANCHPFLVNKSLGFVHNGVISGFGVGEQSDTNHFNEEIIKPLVSKWGNLSIFQPAMKNLIEARIGYSKLIFLDRHGNCNIFNESKGVWDKGVWYSNLSYKPYEPPKPIPNPKSYYSGSPAIPIVSSAKYISTPYLKVNDLVKLTNNFYDWDTKQTFKRGEIFEVVSVNNNFTADLMLDSLEVDDNSFAYNVPFALLDIIIEDDEVIPYDYSRGVSDVF
jgi:glutamine amidotransferase